DETTHRIDLYKRGHFVMEAKDVEPGVSTELLVRKAFVQARDYAINLPEESPPFLMAMDVAATLLVWQRRAGSYGGFNATQRIPLPDLANRPDDVALLRDIWLDPEERHCRGRRRLAGQGRLAAGVTRSRMRLAESAVASEMRTYPKKLPCERARGVNWPAVGAGNGSVAALPADGADRARTGDPLLAKQVLSQLSYSPGRTAERAARE